MGASTSADLVTAWAERAGGEFADHFHRAWAYFDRTVDEIASQQAAWTITTHAEHAVLVLAGDTAFAIVAFSGPPDGVTISGALHPLQEGMVRVSFNDRLATAEIELDGVGPIRPMIRQWTFDWHGRLQLPIEYWLQGPWTSAAGQLAGSALLHHERQRAMAHTLARAAGWPMQPEDG